MIDSSFTTLLVIITCFTWILFEQWVVLRDRKKLDLSKDQQTIHGVYLKSMLSMALAILSKLLLPAFLITSSPEIVRYIGISIMIIGLVLRYWAITTLGKFFRRAVMTQGDHKLIQEGPYQWLRHPSYSGALLGMIGFSLTLNNSISFILAVLFGTYAFIGRINVEEDVLSQHFGEEYKRFSKKTKRLIPFVW